MDPQPQLRALWHRVSAIAARQHGVISRRGLLRLGLSPTQIRDRVRAGLLHPIHRGVYAVGHTKLTREGLWMAAVLTGGPTAVLSHHTAAALHQLLDYPASSPPHVTTASKGLGRPGIAFHSASLARDERTKRQNIPTTTIPRTIFDMAACLDAFALERLLAEAHFRGFRNLRPLHALIARHPRKRGLATLRSVLAAGDYTLGRTESPLPPNDSACSSAARHVQRGRERGRSRRHSGSRPQACAREADMGGGRRTSQGPAPLPPVAAGTPRRRLLPGPGDLGDAGDGCRRARGGSPKARGIGADLDRAAGRILEDDPVASWSRARARRTGEPNRPPRASRKSRLAHR